MDMDQKQEELGPECDPVQTEKAGEDPGGTLEERRGEEETEGKRKDTFASSSGGSASQSEAEQQVRQRQIDPARPTVLEPLVEPGNRQRYT